MLLLNARPSSSIVENVIMYEKKEICDSHLHYKLMIPKRLNSAEVLLVRIHFS